MNDIIVLATHLIIVIRVLRVDDGRIQDTSGEVIYRVVFKALVFKPFKGEVLDGVVSAVDNNGFMIRSGPLESFVSAMVKLHFI